MAKSYASAVVPANAETAWDAVRPFDGLPRWHAGIVSSEIEDDRPAAEVGCVRRLTLPDGGIVRERLVVLDDPRRSYTYDMLEGPFAIRSYRATIAVTPVTGTGEAFVEWYAHFDADGADEPDLDRTFSAGVFATGLAGLREYLSGFSGD